MRLAIQSTDPLFRAAATGISGGLGHTIVDGATGPADVVVFDAGTVDLSGVAAQLDSLRTLVFLPARPLPIVAPGVTGAFLHVFLRTALAVEVPPALETLAI